MENNKNMTAVEWLIERLEINNSVSRQGEFWNLLKNQAKQMEKEQIKDAHLIGLISSMEIEATKQAEQYYNETYGKQDKQTN